MIHGTKDTVLTSPPLELDGEVFPDLDAVGTTITVTVTLADGTDETQTATVDDAAAGTVNYVVSTEMADQGWYEEILYTITDSGGNVYQSLVAQYPESSPVEVYTLHIKETLDPDKYNDLLDQAMIYADQKIITALTKANITPPDNDDTLEQAGNLYAAAQMIDAYYVNADNRPSTAVNYEKQADDLLNGYIEAYLNSHSDSDENIQPLTATYISNS